MPPQAEPSSRAAPAPMPRFGHVLITGASSGIGAALARACAAPGVTLHLGGRDAARLEFVAAACRAAGAEATPAPIDVRDAAGVAAWIDGAGRLDLVVANAGISAGTGGHGTERPEQTRAILATNLDGALNTVLPAMAAMARQTPGGDGRRGTIAAIASIAALLPTPAAPSYGAGKAALDAWMVATAPSAAREGIRLVSVCPGFIRTPMTASNPFPMPGLMGADRAARLILRGADAGRVRVAFPRWMAALAALIGALPPALALRILARTPAKPAAPPG